MARTKKGNAATRQHVNAPPLRAVLDANAIIGRRYRLDGPHVAILEHAISLGKVELIIPKVVLEEVQNKYREEIVKAEQDISNAINKVNILLPAEHQRTLKAADVDRIVIDFSQQFNRKLAQLKARIPGYHDIPHVNLIRRDLERRRPFQRGGGYRDSLIWENVLRVAAKNTLTVFVTQNTKDFCSEQAGCVLHSDLLADLNARGLGEDAVKVSSTIEAFVDEHLKPLLAPSQQALALIQRDQYKLFSFSKFFEENRGAIQEQLDAQVNRSGIPGWSHAEIEDPRVIYIEDPSSMLIREAYELDPEKLFLAYDIVTDVKLQFFVYKADYYVMSEDIEVEDDDWNEHYIWASKTLALLIRFSLELKLGTPSQVESFDVEFPEFYGWCWKCNAPIESDAAETCPNCRADLLRPKRKAR